MEQKNEKKDCPFWKEPCHEDRCPFWIQMQAATVGPLGVMKNAETMSVCLFTALPMLIGSLQATLQVAMVGKVSGGQIAIPRQ